MSEQYKPTPPELQETAAGDVSILVATMVVKDIPPNEIIVSTCKISDLVNAEKSNWAMLHHGGDDNTCNN